MIRTGNIQNNVEILKRLLIQIKYPEKPDIKLLTSGAPEIFLPIIHYTLFNYSQTVAKFLSENKFDMFAKNDLDFINTSFKCLIKLFNYKPVLNSKQFFSDGFAEGKIILCSDIINLIKNKNKELNSNFKTKKNSRDIVNKKSDTNKNDNDIYSNTQELQETNFNNTNFDNNNNNVNFENKDAFDSNFINNNNYVNNNNSINNNSINNNINNNNDDIYQNNNNYNDNFNQDNDYINNALYSSGNIPNNTNNSNIENVTIKNIPNSSIHSSTFNSLQNSAPINNNNSDFTVLVQVISSLSNSVTQMANKIEKFKTSIEDRLSKVEAEISLIKNRQNILEDKLNISNESSIKKGGYNSSNKSSVEMNDQIFSFAAEKNIDNYQSGHFNNIISSSGINNQNGLNINENNDYNIDNNEKSNKYEDTDLIIKNVEKKFRETRQLLSQLNDTGKMHNIYINKEEQTNNL